MARYLICVILTHLICLTAEHYVAIKKPLHYEEWCRCRYIVCRLVLSWTFPFLSIVLNKLEYNYGKFLIDGLIVLCFLLMLVVYILIFCEIRKQQRFENSQNIHTHKNNQALVTTIFIMVTFILCWIPQPLIQMWHAIDADMFENPYVYFICHIIADMMFFNSICDALIYSIRLTEVKKLWRKTFCCVGPCSHSSNNQ